jgi:hypothetical protein
MRVCTVGLGGVTTGGVVVGVVVVVTGVVWPVVGGMGDVEVVGVVCALVPPTAPESLAMATLGPALTRSAHVNGMRVLMFTEVKGSQRRGILPQLSFRLHSRFDSRPMGAPCLVGF